MTPTTRQQRIRRLVKRLNRERRQQAKQIDILCHNLIDAQREFIRRLGTIGLAARFYRSILGVTESRALFQKAGAALQEFLPGSEVVFCCPGQGLWRCGAERPDGAAAPSDLERSLDDAVIAAVTRENRPCDAEDLLALGLQAKPSVLTGCQVQTVPLSDRGQSVGFVLLHRSHAVYTPEDVGTASILAGAVARVLCAPAGCVGPDR